MAITKRGYGESMIYSKYPEYEKNILDFIMSSERIDKMSDRFLHVSEDVKRRQVTAVLHRTLMDEGVVLCIHRKGMPAAFKVFQARDVKEGRQPRVFIDVTDLVVQKEGYYECPKIDVLCTYLMAAMVMLVYEREPEKLLNSSLVVSSSTSCFVSMFIYILDYLRVNGFSENRIKISYIVAMYYQYHLLGKDRDRTAMNIAIKTAGGATKDLNAYEFYYNTEDLNNIGTLINLLSSTFKLQGLTADVFLEKWLWLIGKGTQFGTEIYTAFSKILTDAYSGTYINNQKSIEKCCGRDMVDYVNAVLRICADVIDRGTRFESAMDREDLNRHRNRKALSEALFTDKRVKEARKKLDASLSGPQSGQIAAVKELVKVLKDTGADQKEKDKHLRIAYFAVNADSDNYILGSKSGYKPVVTAICKEIKPHISPKLKSDIVANLEKVCGFMPEQLAKKNETFMKHEKESRAVLKDAQDALKIMS